MNSRRLMAWIEPGVYVFIAALFLLWLSGSGLITSPIGWGILGVVGIALYALTRSAVLAARIADGAGPPGRGVVEIAERRIAYLSPDAGGYVALDELVRVDIMSTPDGPFEDEMFWILIPIDGDPLTIPKRAWGAEYLLGALEALPGFEHAQVSAAMSARRSGVFTVWRRR